MNSHSPPIKAGPATTPAAVSPVRRVVLQSLLLGFTPFIFGACAGGLLPKPSAPPARFTLDDGSPMPVAAQPSAAGAPLLLVERPRAAPGFDGPGMVYLQRSQELQVFAFHEWVDTPAAMLAPLLQQALQAGGAFGAVLLAPSAARAEWHLETELLRLQQDFGTVPSEVRLTLRATLLHSGMSGIRQVRAWREFDQRVATRSDDPVAGAVASHHATRRLLAELVAWCAETTSR